ncbi:hypothetical protein BO83DRAFT_355202 [Aspergillus eucalypticola CBS 122712]|uniref:Uncharacterized protein n=1 Tax=Aspergillus eucalypticola (strain CBS 122712 / IBT 29274) TaxID=1448314 RepID=A0A317W1T8_ASPEC|nr:uncharacterized protein BO83DRAFT_355202 [Aspergillus eucalypticola CBS 122712]PWY79955.1 hypothetical protein BO83DRAFT_355202 [Aspergillus eucalypticola CBS 122712]
MSTFTAWQADLFLLEHWQKDLPESVEAQREEIFAKYVALGVCGREPYRNQQRKLEKRSVRDLPVPSQELLNRIRLPAERYLNEDPCWLRTCYDPSTEGSWARIQDYIDTKVGGSVTVFNDSFLYNFGSSWEKIFLRVPQLLDNTCLFEEYEENVQEALEEGLESDETDPHRAEESGYDPEEDGNPWICFFSEYLFRLAAGHIHIVDEKTLASEGADAGTVLIIWYDECGRAIRYYREEAMHAAEIANLDPCYLKERACWNNAEIGESYKWGAPLGPPYSLDESRGETSE